MPKFTRMLQGVGLALAMTATSATAAMIDFSSAAWSGAGGSSHTVGAVTASTNYGRLTHDSSHGLGIYDRDFLTGTGDEVDNREILSIDLGVSSLIEKIVVHKLFADEGLCPPFCYDERGEYRLDGGSWTSFTGTMSSQPGMLAIMVGAAAQTIDFRGDRLLKDDFSLKAIKTPEPGTLALLGLGLAGIGAFRRRKTA